jgi:hypothetical protein
MSITPENAIKHQKRHQKRHQKSFSETTIQKPANKLSFFPHFFKPFQ